MNEQDNRLADARTARPEEPANTDHALRQQAEQRVVPAASLTNTEALSPDAMRHTLHQLRECQIELKKQQEELRLTRMALNASQAHFCDFYDLAPVGYLTLNEQCQILHSNLTTALLLGESTQSLVQLPFSRFIFKNDQDIFYLMARQLTADAAPQASELQLVRHDGTRFWAHLRVIAAVCDGTPVLRVVLSDISARKQAEEARRIAAIAFECQEGILVMDAKQNILRVNQAFTRITGYSQQDAAGKTTDLLRPGRYPQSFYEDIWRDIIRAGAWHGEMWQRRKTGEEYPARVTTTVVRNEQGQVTHYVGNLTDITDLKQQEQQRLQHEAAHRNILVREVHHRIKNNLQGIMGLLRQFAQKHPMTADPINQAISQVQSISVIHGLQGQKGTPTVRLCELTSAIAEQTQNLWQTPLTVDIPANWAPCIIAEKEAVPIALVLNELILNAVKHGDRSKGPVFLTLRKGHKPDVVQIIISNPGQLNPASTQAGAPYGGLQLISALLPSHGASLVREQHGDLVLLLLELTPPVIFLEPKEPA